MTVNELITLVDIALGAAPPAACSDGGLPIGGEVNVAVVIQAVNNALDGCPARICGGVTGLPCSTGEVCDRRDPTCAVADLAGTCVPGPLPCLLKIDPVCGCDAVTYANDCTRLGAGATLAHAGTCAGGP